MLEQTARELVRYSKIVLDYEFTLNGQFHRMTTFETKDGDRYVVHKIDGETIEIRKSRL